MRTYLTGKLRSRATGFVTGQESTGTYHFLSSMITSNDKNDNLQNCAFILLVDRSGDETFSRFFFALQKNFAEIKFASIRPLQHRPHLQREAFVRNFTMG